MLTKIWEGEGIVLLRNAAHGPGLGKPELRNRGKTGLGSNLHGVLIPFRRRRIRGSLRGRGLDLFEIK